jgi:tetraacyldisaccharide 4'-kinase
VIAQQIWTDESFGARAARAALSPFAFIYRMGTTARRILYDRGLLTSTAASIPVASVGNLTVGGTGKTPFAAWLAERLSAHARPAIVIRGYGADETSVHQQLNPQVPVIVDADRARGIEEARRRGADIVVLDDGFQHRRVERVSDIVLVSVEQMTRPVHLLPAGPWREPLASARRATLVVLTRKAATDSDVERARARLQREAPGVPMSVVRFAPGELVNVDSGSRQPIDLIRGVPVLAVAAIGEPGLFAQQLAELGAEVTLAAFRDHHEFTARDVTELADRVAPAGLAICTLKDAVKLRGWWPGASRLWYVSQQLKVEQGQSELDRVIEKLLDARVPHAANAL